MHEITADSLTKALGVEVPDIYVVMAKHSVMGTDSESIQKILGCDQQDIKEVEDSELYKVIRTQVAAAHANQTVDQTSGWDALESTALKNLLKRMPYEKDPELLLRVAAVANKAQRRTGQDSAVLDPARANGKTAITLTQRLVHRLSRGEEVTEETRQLSIHDGSMGNPSFAEVDSLLSVRNVPVLPRNLEIQTRSNDPSVDDLLGEMGRRGR